VTKDGPDPITGVREPLRSIPLSVIVSTRDSARTLKAVLVAIRGGHLPASSYELIVVDDASSDGSVAIAARYVDTVVKLSGQLSGPAYSRNRGVELARGEIVVFVDDDVLVEADTLARMLAILAERPDIDAVSATHDVSAGAANFTSQYWNLLVRFGEQRHAGPCAQFAPGCGAVRRRAFLDAGMYDEWRFATSSLEGVELGERLLGTGGRALLSPQLRVRHLRPRDLRSVCHEVWSRGKMLARSLGYSRMNDVAPGEVIFTLSRTLTPAIALVGTLMLAGAFVSPPHSAADVGMALVVLLVANLPVHRFYAQSRGLGFAIASAPLHLIVQMVAGAALCKGWIVRYLVGDVSRDATTQAYSEVGLEIWPPVPRRRR
jgi:hypothetical protein